MSFFFFFFFLFFFLEREMTNNNMVYKALLKYGYFSLELYILKVVGSLSSREWGQSQRG